MVLKLHIREALRNAHPVVINTVVRRAHVCDASFLESGSYDDDSGFSTHALIRAISLSASALTAMAATGLMAAIDGLPRAADNDSRGTANFFASSVAPLFVCLGCLVDGLPLIFELFDAGHEISFRL